MSSPATTTSSSSSGGSHLSAILSPVRYEGHNFLPSVTSSQHSQSPYEPPTLPPLPYSLHRDRNTSTLTPPRNFPSLSNSETIIEKEPSSSSSSPSSSSNLLPSVSSAPEILNNEVIVSNQPVVSEAGQDGDNSNALVPGSKSGQTYVDITDYLNMPQSEAAKKLGIPTSTLSKRWKEAVRGRKWPYRMICKLDKEIMTLLHNVPQGANGTGGPPFPEDIENTLTRLIRLRNEELKSVVIRI